jgi:3-oxoacyl-ACP reductase-like protein
MTSSIDKLFQDVNNHKIAINNEHDYESMKRNIYKLRKIASIFDNMTKNYEIKNNIKNKENSNKENKCYICRVPIPPSHDFYKSMCHKCGMINKLKRDMFVDQKNKVAIVTGGRVKIGYETALRLLRCGCHVIITSRFAKDALERYMKEADYEKWINNPKIFEADFLSLQDTKDFIEYIFTAFRILNATLLTVNP